MDGHVKRSPHRHREHRGLLAALRDTTFRSLRHRNYRRYFLRADRFVRRLVDAVRGAHVAPVRPHRRPALAVVGARRAGRADGAPRHLGRRPRRPLPEAQAHLHDADRRFSSMPSPSRFLLAFGLAAPCAGARLHGHQRRDPGGRFAGPARVRQRSGAAAKTSSTRSG